MGFYPQTTFPLHSTSHLTGPHLLLLLLSFLKIQFGGLGSAVSSLAGPRDWDGFDAFWSKKERFYGELQYVSETTYFIYRIKFSIHVP